jgi:hypothetical protein
MPGGEKNRQDRNEKLREATMMATALRDGQTRTSASAGKNAGP